MYTISKIVQLIKMDDYVWNVVFQMDEEPLEYTTDFLYLVKEEKWVFNSLITHELTSLMAGHTCSYCGENKIACSVASKECTKIKQAILKNDGFRKVIEKELTEIEKEISVDFMIINNKSTWDKLAEENRFYGNVLRIQKKNKKLTD